MKRLISVFIFTSVALLSDENAKIQDLIIGVSDITFTINEPDSDYLVATTSDLTSWELSQVFESQQGQKEYSVPRVMEADERAFFTIIELSTTDKIHSDDFDFLLTVESVEPGEIFSQDNGSATMQAMPQDDEVVGVTEEISINVSVDLNELTISLFGLTGDLEPDELGYKFEIVENYPRESVWSDGDVEYFEENTEIFSGRYDLLSGQIELTHQDISRLSWNLTNDISIKRVVNKVTPL